MQVRYEVEKPGQMKLFWAYDGTKGGSDDMVGVKKNDRSYHRTTRGGVTHHHKVKKTREEK